MLDEFLLGIAMGFGLAWCLGAFARARGMALYEASSRDVVVASRGGK